ncbi:MAG: diacylglycerol kinase family protein [Candidatus Krumholzibacteriia bacterium]
MTSSAAAIVNPAAGTRRRRLAPSVVAERLRACGLEPEILLTRHAGHASDLARAAAERHPLVVAVGGDGTLHEVARGLVGTGATLAVVPVGSGNDFAAALGAGNPEAAWRVVAAGVGRDLDVGYFGERPFFNSVGLFVSGLVSWRAARLRRPFGPARYMAAALATLIRARPTAAVWQLDRKRWREDAYLLAEICNGPRTGGTFYLMPEADPFDGLLGLCLVRPLGLAAALRLLPAVTAGRTVDHPAVERLHLREGNLVITRDTWVHVDGEPGPLAAGIHSVRLRAGALRVLATSGFPRPEASGSGVGPGGSR